MADGKESCVSGVSSHIESLTERGPPHDFHSDLKEDSRNNPNDPQNWSTSAQYTTYLTICAFTFLVNVNGSNFTVATKAIINEFHVFQTQAGELFCFDIFLFGLGNII